VSHYQKGKTNLDFIEASDSECQWHQLGHMQVCTLLQTDNHTSTPSLCFFTGRMPFLPPNQQRQSTEGTVYCNTQTYEINQSKNSSYRGEFSWFRWRARKPCELEVGKFQDEILAVNEHIGRLQSTVDDARRVSKPQSCE